MERILVVGGAGVIGSMVLPLLEKHFEVRVADLQRPKHFSGEFFPADVLDPQTIKDASHGCTSLIYLAMGQKSDWGSYSWAKTNFQVNVTGLHLTLRAAIESGVKKFVYASSTSIFADELMGHSNPTPDATDAYGQSKYFGEQICEAMSREFGVVSIALRLVGPMADEDWQTYQGGGDREIVTAASDIATAFLAATFADLNGFHALLVTGDHEKKFLDWSSTQNVLGWSPLARRG